MPSVYSPRWTPPETPQHPHCDVPGCTLAGEYKAPKHRNSSRARDYHHFCLRHVQDYNKSWNFFAGMSDSESQRYMYENFYGERPTAPRNGGRFTRERLKESVYTQFNDYFTPGQQAGPGTPATIDSRVRKALAVLDLAWPVSEAEVKTRYKTLVKQFHPDLNKEPGAEARFRAVAEAYHQLTKALPVLAG